MKHKPFHYTYIAPTEAERREISQIRTDYTAPEKTVTTLDRVRMLDAFVKNTATMVGLILGIVGLLLFGLGMAMVLEWGILLWGILICAIGCVPMGFAYPAYLATLKHNKEKYGPEILRLTEELLGDGETVE